MSAIELGSDTGDFRWSITFSTCEECASVIVSAPVVFCSFGCMHKFCEDCLPKIAKKFKKILVFRKNKTCSCVTKVAKELMGGE